MPDESLELQELHLCHSKLRTLDLGLTPNLKKLNLENCSDLVEINAPIGCLKSLVLLALSGCGRFKSFWFDKRTQPAEVGSLSELHLIAEPTDVCLLRLENDSPKLECLEELDQLECLEELTFSSEEIKYLPDSICKLKHLKSLELDDCLLLEKLPEDIGRLESLERVILTDCKLLQDIPNSICKMKCINELHLRGCTRVVELPEDIGCLEGLKELNIAGTGIIRLPQSIFRLRGLRIVGSIRLIDAHGLLLKRRRTYDGDDDDDEIVRYI